ncbi:MAG: HAD family hydrolase [Anaerolineae bacterium]
MIEVIAFDADDTLWHNESIYHFTQAQFAALLAPYCTPETVEQRLYQTEMRNLQHYGYGVKSFTLSMIETAIELSEGKIRGGEIQQIIDFARQMLREPVHLLAGVVETVTALAKDYRLMVITKGDLFDQESKVARSGLGDRFFAVEVVSVKNAEVYRALLAKHDIAPERFLMVGNSLPSDVLPVAEIGGRAVHIPYHITWQHESGKVDDVARQNCIELEDIRQLPALLRRL